MTVDEKMKIVLTDSEYAEFKKQVLKNGNHQFLNAISESYYATACNILLGAFDWYLSDMGKSYWNKIFKRLKKLENEQTKKA